MTAEGDTSSRARPLPRAVETAELGRIPVRQRLGMVTLSAWRLFVTSDEGPGSIVLIESGDDDRFYRGEGVFLGWSQADLAAAWEALLPRPAPPEEPPLQLG